MSLALDSAPVPSYGHDLEKDCLLDEQAYHTTNDVNHTKDSHPSGFPSHITSPLAWKGCEFQQGGKDYSITLSKFHIKELEDACQSFERSGLPLDEISRSTFPLPTLAGLITSLSQELYTGNGFFVVHGLDPTRYSSKTNILLYVGLSTYISETRGRQDEHGNMLLHLIDLGDSAAPAGVRQAPYSNVGQPFHTDVGDVIGLYALDEAARGGESMLASSWSVYNILCKSRPDIIRLLSEPSWIFDRFGLQPPCEVRPVLFPTAMDTIMTFFAPRPLVGTSYSPRTIPPLPDTHIEALDTVQSVAEQVALALRLARGDMLFWNNRVLLHCRKGFTDSSSQKRHLVRVWLKNEASQSGELPAQLRHLWDEAFGPCEGKQQWPIEPITSREYVTNQQRSSGHA